VSKEAETTPPPELHGGAGGIEGAPGGLAGAGGGLAGRALDAGRGQSNRSSGQNSSDGRTQWPVTA
jgi:hypothetical protein